MATHDRTVGARKRRVTQIGREYLRAREESLFTKFPRVGEQSRDLMRRVTGTNPGRLCGLPDIPSVSRLSHWRHDEENPFTSVAAFVYALAEVGEGRETCELIVLRVREWIADAYGDDPQGELGEILMALSVRDGEEDTARLALALADSSTDALIDYRDKVRAEIATAEAALVEVNRALAARRVA